MLKVGMVIQLKKKDDDDYLDQYKSRIVDVEDGLIMVDYPIHVETGRTAFFMDGTELIVTVTDELKVSHRFKASVEGRRIAKIPMLQLAHENEENFAKIQRREFVRVNANVDVAVSFDADILRLVSSDISAGGLKLNLSGPTTLNEKMAVSLLVVLPFIHREIEYVRATASVIRIFEQDQRTIASLKFVDIADADRQQVIQFCFERQVELKKKMEKKSL